MGNIKRRMKHIIWRQLGHFNSSFNSFDIDNRLLTCKPHEVCNLLNVVSSRVFSIKQLFSTYLMNVRMNECIDRSTCIYRLLRVHIVHTITKFMLQEKQTIKSSLCQIQRKFCSLHISVETLDYFFSSSVYLSSFQNLYMFKKCVVYFSSCSKNSFLRLPIYFSQSTKIKCETCINVSDILFNVEQSIEVVA